ncbi:hypothetical protein MKW98_013627, partial [Papaver atlanticum]
FCWRRIYWESSQHPAQEDDILSLLCEEKDPKDLMIEADINDENLEKIMQCTVVEQKSNINMKGVTCLKVLAGKSYGPLQLGACLVSMDNNENNIEENHKKHEEQNKVEKACRNKNDLLQLLATLKNIFIREIHGFGASLLGEVLVYINEKGREDLVQCSVSTLMDVHRTLGYSDRMLSEWWIMLLRKNGCIKNEIEEDRLTYDIYTAP